MSLSLPYLVFAHLFPSGFYYGWDSYDKARRSGERERGRKGESGMSWRTLMHDGMEVRMQHFISWK